MRSVGILFLILPFFTAAQQHVYCTLFFFFSNYQGDLRNKRLAWDQSQAAFGAGMKYDLNPHIGVRSGIIFAKIEGDDKKNIESLRYRNLNFQSNILEWNVMLEYSFFSLDAKHFSPYIFAGVGIFHFDPYTYDTLGKKYYLQPLCSEGDLLSQYPHLKMYNLTQANIPFGGGIRFLVANNLEMGFEFGFRKLFTDYVDDVSLTYADRSVLLQGRGAKVLELAYRAGELKTGNPIYPSGNLQRGQANRKDWYYFQGIFLSIDMNTFSNFALRRASNGDRGRVSCPKKW